MYIIYTMFKWGEPKRKQVMKEHGIDFEKIEDVFDDPFAIDLFDHEHSNENEQRYIIIGKTAQYGLIRLVYTMPDEYSARFITARRAENWIVREYEKRRKRT